MSPRARSTALVIGGSGGIGAAVARRVARDVDRVVVTFRSGAHAAAELAAELRDAGGDAAAVFVDLSDPTSVAAAVDAARGEGNEIGQLHFCAGARFRMDYLGRTSAAEVAEALAVEAAGFARVVEAALPSLRDARGAIVALSSAALGRHVPKDALSTAPKAAVEALVRAVAREEGRFGVRANAVRVGVVDGGMFHHFAAAGGGIDQRWVEAATANVPLGRLGSPDEVAEVAAFLGGRAASYVTGQAVAVDGGFSV